MPNLQEALDQLKANPKLITDPGFQAIFANASQEGQGVQGEQQQAPMDENALRQQLMNDPQLAKHPLRGLLTDPEFYNWFKVNYPDEQYPPSPQDMRSYWDTYEQAGGNPSRHAIGGHDLGGMMKPGNVFDKDQAREFNNIIGPAFGGNPPLHMNPKKKGFHFHLDKNKQLRAFGRGVKDIVKAGGPLIGAGIGGAVGGLPGAALGGMAGAGLGGALGGGDIGGKKERMDRFSLLTPGQEKATNQLLTEGMKNTAWGPIEQQAREGFYTKTMPTLAERFEVMGGGNQRTGALAPAIASAGGQLERGLAGMKSQYGMQQLGMGLQPRAFENVFRPGQPGLGQQLAGGAAQFLPFLAAKMIGI